MLTKVIQYFGFENENTIWFANQMDTHSEDELAFMMDMLLDPPFDNEVFEADIDNMAIAQGF